MASLSASPEAQSEGEAFSRGHFYNEKFNFFSLTLYLKPYTLDSKFQILSSRFEFSQSFPDAQRLLPYLAAYRFALISSGESTTIWVTPQMLRSMK